MAGKRRQATTGATNEIAGIVLMLAGFTLLTLAAYKIGGLYAGLIPGALALMWVGYNMASRVPPPHGTPGGTPSGTPGGTPSGTPGGSRRDFERDSAGVPEYRDPDAELPAGLYEQATQRDLVPVERDLQRD